MTLYRIMDLVKNGIAISYLFFLVLSLFPPEPRLSSWWFNYHVQYYGILCAIPLPGLLSAAIYCRGTSGSAGEKEKVPFPRKKRFTLSAATAVPVFLVLLGGRTIIPGAVRAAHVLCIAVFDHVTRPKNTIRRDTPGRASFCAPRCFYGFFQVLQHR